jgi:hypothetical protein
MKLNKKTLAVSTVTLAVVGGTSAFAYWTTTGTGTGSGTMATGDGSSVTLTTGAIDGLTPGGSVTVDIYASNDSGVDATVETATAGAITITEAEGVTGTCSVDWFTAAVEGTGSATSVPTGSTGTDVEIDQDLTVSMTNPSENQDACKGASIEVALTTP